MRPFLPFAIGIVSILFSVSMHAQNMPIDSGVIVFEKKVDVYSFLDTVGEIKGIGDIRDRYQRVNPQFQTTLFTLYFNAGKTLYEPLQKAAASENEILDFIGQ